MEAARTRYELRVGTVVSRAAIASFHVPVRSTAVPRHTILRIRVPADRDLYEVLHRLTEHDVQVLEIRRCPEPRGGDRGTAPARQDTPRQDPPRQQAPQEEPGAPDATTSGAVVLPFPGGTGPRGRASRGAAPEPPRGSSAG
jgi:hypothetical protein